MTAIKSRIPLHACLLFLCALLAYPLCCTAKENQPSKPTPTQNENEFSYSSQDRRDPFEPVYIERSKQKGKESLKQGYELEELSLVGIIQAGLMRFAVMEDAQGRGLWFKKGDRLNSNLWVSDILEDKVVMATSTRGDVRKIVVDIPRK
jgi:Tfp pilus assembly protein PilP